MHRGTSFSRGMTLIDVVVGVGVMLTIFLAIFGLLRASAVISTLAANKAAATALANSHMEYLRSLPYDSIGTIGGIPPGVVAPYATSTVDNVAYSVRTFIDYYDDPADGSEGLDSNSITTDYKRAKVSVSYETDTGTKQLQIVSTFAPPSIETTTNGGTIRVTVVNASGAPVPGAGVRIVNASTSPSIDLTTFSDSTGIVYLPGAPTSTEYKITVTKDAYSTAKTYDRDETNQNPTPGHLTVVKNQTTTGTFAIDLLASILFHSFNPIVSGSWTDSFADATRLGTMNNTSVSGGELTLSNDGSGYVLSGDGTTVLITPAYLVSWSSLAGTISVPTDTTLSLHVADSTGTLIPDAVLPGNSIGFSSFPIGLSSLATTTYPALMLRTELSTSATSTTPAVLDWTVEYRTGPTPLPNVSFTLEGAKTIGSTGGGLPIYKTSMSTTTSASGTRAVSLEWDSYTLSTSGQHVLNVCTSHNVLPGASREESLFFGNDTTHSLLVTAQNTSSTTLPYARVTLTRSGFSETVTASACGVAYFGDLASANDYALSAASGALSASETDLSVSGHTTYEAILE
ncbi:MAG: carboxypeptidase-like regulatory domain-containing protein [Minisyncoccia bacterium]